MHQMELLRTHQPLLFQDFDLFMHLPNLSSLYSKTE